MSHDRSEGARWGPVHLVLTADPMAVRTAVATLLAGFPPRFLHPDNRASAEIVISEALNNIVEHAYPDGIGQIALSLNECSDGLTCEIRDQGAPMPGGILPEGRLPDNDGPDLPEGGFGWFMIRTLTRDVRYVRHGGTNRLNFVIPAHQFPTAPMTVDVSGPMPQ